MLVILHMCINRTFPFMILVLAMAITRKPVWIQGDVQGLLYFLRENLNLYERGIETVCHLVYLEIEHHQCYNTYSF